jgi:xylulokinase
VLLLGLDVGTAGASAVAIDQTGTVVASRFAGYALHASRPGWVEQDPSDWWHAATHVLAGVAADVRGEISGLGLTGQPGSVFVDAAGAPVRAAILRGDRRAVSQAQRISDSIGTRHLIEISGSAALADHQASALLWLRDVEPVQFRHTRRMLLPKDHVRLLLTGEAVTDATDGAGTGLLDLRQRRWSEEILEILEIPVESLPQVHESLEIAGGLRPSVAAEMGLPPGLPVAAGASDTAAGALGTGIVAGGLVGSSIDSRGRLDAQLTDAVVDPGGLVQTACDPAPHRYHLAGTIPSAGGSLRWWRDVVGWRLGYEELCAQAESAAVGAHGLFFKPHVDGEGSPLHGGGAQGAFVGLRTHHAQADLTRAVMEGIVFSLRERLDVMRALGIDLRQVRATGGGARSQLWRQMQADIFAVPVAAMASAPSPAVAAALLAGVATGVFSDVAAASATVVRLDSVLEPDPDRVARYEQLFRTFTALESAIRQPASL